jgi:hypothetical protein
MNRYFLTGAIIYQACLVLFLMIGDTTLRGQDERQLLHTGVYTLGVFCSLLLAISAVKSAVTKQRSGLLRWAVWPPEWDATVAFWAAGKAFFFTILWLYALTFRPPVWLLTVSLIAFVNAHVIFTGKWLALPDDQPPDQQENRGA